MIRIARAKCFLPLFIIIVGAAACENNKATSPEQRYFYYPKANTYFDSKSLEYIYSLDSARTWVKMKTATGQIPSAALGDQVAIKETSDDVWNENETHRNMYGGTLYNVITKDTTLLTDKPKEIKKTVSKQDTEEPDTKKKRNIFQKIFGKKNN